MYWSFYNVYLQKIRDIILTQNVFAFLKNENNVIDPDEVIFVPDKTPCMPANKTQDLLQDNDVKFWGNHLARKFT